MGGTATVGWSELARVPWQESVIVPESLQLCTLYDSRGGGLDFGTALLIGLAAMRGSDHPDPQRDEP